MNKRFDKDNFPKVPETVHQAVLDAFDRLEEKPASIVRMPRKRSAAGMLRVALVAGRAETSKNSQVFITASRALLSAFLRPRPCT